MRVAGTSSTLFERFSAEAVETTPGWQPLGLLLLLTFSESTVEWRMQTGNITLVVYAEGLPEGSRG